MALSENILSLLPQAPPFVLIDELLYADEDKSRTSFRVRPETIFVEKGFFSAAGLMENIAQTVAAGAGYAAKAKNDPVRTGYITSVKNLEIAVLPGIGDELITETTIQTRVLDIIVISGKITCNGKIMATGEINILIGQPK
jgi:predicted hotdog family 3-hydroxylacyl-ACP dehydratase